MSNAPPHTPSAAIATTLEAATAALKIAREATDAVPIVKQILGVASNIFELAERIEKKRQAMFDLVLAVGEYSKEIDMTVAGRTVDAKMQRSLDRLHRIFIKIETLLEKETAPKNAAIRTLRNVFVLPSKAESLAAELEMEIKLFQLSSGISTRFAITDTARIVEEDSQYDGDWRRLRHGDVQKLHVINTYAVDNGVLTYASARVNNELMIIRYLDEPLGHGRGASDYDSPSPPRRSSWISYPDLIRRLSTVHASHPNVVQLYGIRGGSPDATFAAFRSGTRTTRDVVHQMRGSQQRWSPSPDPFALVTTTLCYKILDAAWYLKYYHNLLWLGNSATIDESGEPRIGAFDDLEDEALADRKAATKSIISTLAYIRQPLISWFTRIEKVENVYDGSFFQSLHGLQLPHAQHLQRLWELLRRESLQVSIESYRFTSSPTTAQVPESAIVHAREHLTRTWEARNLDRYFFDAGFYHVVLQKTLPQPMHSGWISVGEHGVTAVGIARATQHEDHISSQMISIKIPKESGINAEIMELFHIDRTFSGYVNLDEVQCYKHHKDCGLPVDCSGARFVPDVDW